MELLSRWINALPALRQRRPSEHVARVHLLCRVATNQRFEKRSSDMIFRERRKSALDADNSEDSADTPHQSVLALAEAAEAAAAEAEARAMSARVRATHLREQVDSQQSDGPEGSAKRDHADKPATGAVRAQRQWLHCPSSKAASIGAAVMLMCTSLTTSGFVAWHHHIASQKRSAAAEFAAAARTDVVALMSLDFNKTNEDMQRIADNATGTFKQHFPVIAQHLTEGLQRSKVVTTATVSDVAVESMTDSSAVVLVAAATQAKEADGPQEPRTWHIAVSLLRDGGRPKMSNVEFVQ
jgi:Mce-associated membrane protein